jgi:hypothetical protein
MTTISRLGLARRHGEIGFHGARRPTRQYRNSCSRLRDVEVLPESQILLGAGTADESGQGMPVASS